MKHSIIALLLASILALLFFFLVSFQYEVTTANRNGIVLWSSFTADKEACLAYKNMIEKREKNILITCKWGMHWRNFK